MQQIHPHMVKAVMLDDNTPVSAKAASSIVAHTPLFFVIFSLDVCYFPF